ncbi:MAG: cytochrome c3 family protein [Phycisphaerae bacterium]|nr:cytochrome c3 family protein [Phycisphaerae bacterium]
MLSEDFVEYRGSPDSAMMMPTDVAACSDGRVFVADGVNSRVLEFSSDGTLLRSFHQAGDIPLGRPIGIAVDNRDRLWLADADHVRIISLESDGSLADVFAINPAGDGRTPDLTDIALSPDGRTAWIVDNDNHRIIRLNLDTGEQTAFGRFGESLGNFNHPFMIATNDQGQPLVTDVINGRVAMYFADGRPARSIGAYGILPGELYRPKGVAVDSQSQIWVSDSVTRVIHVFNASGGFIDVVRDRAGNPFKFETPMGIAIQEDRLYVTELTSNRARACQITRGPIVIPRTTERRSQAQLFGREARGCTVCHMEWMSPLKDGQSTPIVDPPPSTPELPHVSRSEVCISCHDGSIADSRRRVWLEHGHQTGIAPPDYMKVPSELPLADGKIMCRTCHSAHTGGNFTGDLSTSVFLRVENAASQLCMGCHEDHTRGVGFGTHPTGGMPWPVPDALIAAGAKAAPNSREITCQVCHTPHGSSTDHLLVMGVTSNELCVTCHGMMRPGMFREGGHAEHPLSPVVNAQQKAAIERMGTRIGDGEKLICLSCHKLHHGKGERFMLAADLHNSEMCINCHSEKVSLFGTSHDLRTNFATEKNRLGMTPESGGPCSACHMFHRYARAPEPHPSDAIGQCITCHQQGRCAQSRALPSHNHPGNNCVGCHNPHETQFGCYLRGTPTDTCLACHAEQGRLLGGPHDLTAVAPKNAEHAARSRIREAITGATIVRATLPADGPMHDQSATDFHNAHPGGSVSTAALNLSLTGDACTACHKPHGSSPADLFRVPPRMNAHGEATTAAAIAEAACTACHVAAGWESGGSFAAVHPREINDTSRAGTLPLSCDAAGADQIGCRTCHDPHARTPSLARVAEGQSPGSLCVQCHSDVSQVLLTSHGAINPDSARAIIGQGLAADDPHGGHLGSGSTACAACHSLHADSSVVERSLLTRPPAGIVSVEDGWMTGQDRYCSACHRQGGTSHPPAVATHPDLPLTSLFVDGAQSALPLFNDDGDVDPRGRITCRTCHVPHGQVLDPQQLVRLAGMPPEQRRPLRLLLRPFVPPNACTTCHGADGLWRFLYYHDPSRRRGADESLSGASDRGSALP